LQLHNPPALPDVQNPESAYAGLLEARGKGQTRFIGISCHRLENALEAVRSDRYEERQSESRQNSFLFGNCAGSDFVTTLQ
jgi:diketogulonate reductase-like aldo/keto reductase